jgi:recombination protein RecA
MAAKTDTKSESKTEAKSEKAQSVRDRNLELALQAIAKEYGDGSIMRLGDENSKLKVDVIPTGSIAIDTALGVGGFPRGRIIEIFGPESSGKTTLTLTVIAQAQRLGGVAAFIDVEHALDPSYARKLGVNMDELLVSQPNSGEEALTIAETLIKSNAVDVVVVDSVAALITRAELEGQMGDATVGAQARLMSQAMRKLTSFISKSRDPPRRDVEAGTRGEHLHVLEAVGDEQNDVGIEEETNRVVVVDDLVELAIKTARFSSSYSSLPAAMSLSASGFL